MWLADVAASRAGERDLFNDVCQLTVDGSEAFADIISPHALEAVTAQRRTRVSLD